MIFTALGEGIQRGNRILKEGREEQSDLRESRVYCLSSEGVTKPGLGLASTV